MEQSTKVRSEYGFDASNRAIHHWRMKQFLNFVFFSVKMEFKTSEFRPAIIRMHEKGESKKKIAELLGISRHAVRDAIKRFEETGSNANRKREKTARSKKNILRAKTMINEI